MRNKTQASRGVLAHEMLILATTIAIGALAEARPSHAQEVSKNEPAEEHVDEGRPTIDLGMFRVKDLRPSRNETVKLSFAIHLALHQSASQATVEQLERWQHRLRDQVIIVIRLAQTKDFLEPNLHRFRRSVLLRVNRLLKATLVSEALLTEFTFSVN